MMTNIAERPAIRHKPSHSLLPKEIEIKNEAKPKDTCHRPHGKHAATYQPNAKNEFHLWKYFTKLIDIDHQMLFKHLVKNESTIDDFRPIGRRLVCGKQAFKSRHRRECRVTLFDGNELLVSNVARARHTTTTTTGTTTITTTLVVKSTINWTAVRRKEEEGSTNCYRNRRIERLSKSDLCLRVCGCSPKRFDSLSCLTTIAQKQVVAKAYNKI